ncbi:MAG: nucleotide exchange factor GrpE [Blastocatellia bacterium]|nr:nucleotide exchange factor GrpE [Blastocatellia bacterium]
MTYFTPTIASTVIFAISFVSLMLISALGYLVFLLYSEVTRLKIRVGAVEKSDDQKRLKEVEDNYSKLVKQQDQDMNSLWAEFEELRNDLLAKNKPANESQLLDQTIAQKHPYFANLKIAIQSLIQKEPKLANLLTKLLPSYLTENNFLHNLYDLIQMPLDKINWLDSLILPLEAFITKEQRSDLEKPFFDLLNLIGYSQIAPNKADLYDPALHEVIEQRVSDQSRGKILAIKAKGYRKGSQILIKAKVAISAGK